MIWSIKNARLPARRNRADGLWVRDYLEDFMTGGGGAALGFGQQDAANKEAAAAMMTSLAIFILVV